MNKCTMHLNFNMPAGYGAIVKTEYICLSLRWPWRPFYFRKAQTQLTSLPKPLSKGLPRPLEGGGPSMSTGLRGFMMGASCLAEQKAWPYRLCGSSCSFSSSWHKRYPYYPFNYWAWISAGLSPLSSRTFVCVPGWVHVCPHLPLLFMWLRARLWVGSLRRQALF